MNKLQKLSKVVRLEKYWNYYLLAFLILIGAFLRFYDFPFRYLLGDETVREAIIGIQGARTLQAPLTGGFSSAGAFTWGPWFYYQMIIAYLIAPFSYTPWIYLTLSTLVSIFLLYKIGNLLYGKYFGLILAFLGTFSQSLIIAGLHLTFPSLVNVFSIASFWIFIKIVKEKISYWWGFALGIVLGISINIHYQSAGLFLLPLLLVFFGKKKISYLLFIFVGVFVTFVPLILWDLTNHWHNLKNIIFFYTEGKNAIYVPNRWLFYLRDFWPSYWGDILGIPYFLAIYIGFIFGLVSLYQIKKRELKGALLALFVSFVLNFIWLRYYWGERSFVYLSYLRPFVFIYTGFALYYPFLIFKKYKKLKLLFIIPVLIVTFYMIKSSLTLLPRDNFSEDMYKTADFLAQRYPGKKFSFYNCESRGNTPFTAVTHSMIFIFDNRGKLGEGVKLGTMGEDCMLPNEERTLVRYYATASAAVKSDFPEIEATYFVDLSKASEENLAASGWSKDEFQKIYDNTARWWFREQP